MAKKISEDPIEKMRKAHEDSARIHLVNNGEELPAPEWLRFPEKKPDKLTLAVVRNKKGWMETSFAVYRPEQEAWVLQDPAYRPSIVLEVTHYIPLRPLPIAERCDLPSNAKLREWEKINERT